MKSLVHVVINGPASGGHIFV